MTSAEKKKKTPALKTVFGFNRYREKKGFNNQCPTRHVQTHAQRKCAGVKMLVPSPGWKRTTNDGRKRGKLDKSFTTML